MSTRSAPSSNAAPSSGLSRAHRFLSAALLLLAHTTLAQIRPDPGGGGGPIVITPPGGGITPPGGGIVLPIPGGPGGGITGPTGVLTAPRGAIAGSPFTVTAAITGAGATPPTNLTYQWSATGARLTGDPRAATTQFIADRAGTVTLNVSINSSLGAFPATASVTIFAANAAGAITAPTTVAASAASVTATVPAAVSNDRTFRWTVSGDATITAGQNTRSITFRPGSPGLKEVVCNVTLQNLAVIPIRSYLVVTGTGPRVPVTINHGQGDGTYPGGSRVDIFANPPPAGQVFDRWTGDTAVLGAGPLAPFLPHSVITVPATPVTLEATYKPAPAWTPATVDNFNPQTQPAAAGQPATTVSTTLIHHVPADPAGLVFLLHDTAGAATDWLTRPEQLLLARDLVAAGYGIAALDSLNRTAGTWAAQTTLATNLDALNHVAALNHFVREGAISSTTPIFFVGLAASANSALAFANFLATASPARPVKGAILYLSTGSEALAVTSRVPQFFILAANDETLGAAGLATAREHSQFLLGRGVATGVVNTTISPVHPGRFRALSLAAPAFTTADADAVWTAVKNAELLDANNYPRSVPTAETLAPTLPIAHRARAADIAAQLAVAAAASEFSSEANPRVLQFLNARAADGPVPNPGRIVNLSTRAKVAHIADTFTLGFTLAGTARATLLIRGIGPTLSRFGVSDPLLAPRLEINQGNRVLASNEGWEKNTNPTPAQIAAAATAVGAFPLPAGALDAAILVQLEAGTYTATLRGLGGTTGDVLAEIYDISRNATRLTNLSTLSAINRDGDLLIPGLVLAGNNPRTLVVRAIGAGLTDFGHRAADVLGDPRLLVLSGSQTVAQNNNWAQAGAATLNAVFPAIGAFPLRAANDAALIEPLAPGTYTLQAGATPPIVLPPNVTLPTTTPAANPTGALLVEIYEVP